MSILYKARHLSVNAVETLLRTPAALHAICIAPPREEEPEAMSPAVPAWRCEERSTLKSLGIELDEVGQILTVGKLWDALKHLLTAASGEDKSPDVNVFRGGTSVEYGGDKARVMTPAQVTASLGGLRELPVSALALKFDGAELDKLNIYYGPWRQEGRFDEIAQAYISLQAYFAEAEALGRGMLIFWE